MSGRYKAYGEYKESGVEWCNKLPLKWKGSNLRWLSYIYAGGTPSKNILDYWENGIVPWINSGAVNQGYVVTPSTYISKVAFENSSAKWIPKDSLVVALAGQGKTKGMVAQLRIDTTCNQSMAAIVFKKSIHSRYVFWWLRSNYQNIRNMSGGDLRDGLNLEILGDIQCPLPSDDECFKISIFLDHETAKIDTLIDKQQQLIELLIEKRQAVISHAVTKGLDPDVQMKDSGVEWLGEVPEHWKVIYIKHLSEVKRGASPRPIDDQKYFDEEGEYAWTRIADVSLAGMYLKDTQQRLSSLGSSLSVKLERGELFLSIAGTVGKPCITTSKACIHDGFVYFPSLKINNKYLFYIFDAGQAYLGLGKMGTQLNLNTDTVGCIKVGLPPSLEIHEIVSYIVKQKEKYDLLISSAYEFIELIQERRTALISAAVTGKIDVRDWQVPATQTESDEVMA